MATQSDPLSRNFDLFRNLSGSFLAGFEGLASWQYDSMQASISRSGQQLRGAWSAACAAREPANWSETVQNGMRNAIKMNRDCLIATTDYQMESMRLLQEMSAGMQQAITEAMNEQLVNIDVVGSREKRRTATLASQKLAA